MGGRLFFPSCLSLEAREGRWLNILVHVDEGFLGILVRARPGRVMVANDVQVLRRKGLLVHWPSPLAEEPRIWRHPKPQKPKL